MSSKEVHPRAVACIAAAHAAAAGCPRFDGPVGPTRPMQRACGLPARLRPFRCYAFRAGDASAACRSNRPHIEPGRRHHAVERRAAGRVVNG